MNNKFNPDEIVKVQGKQYPVVGGRLRLAHDENKSLSIETIVVNCTNELVTIQATVTTERGKFSGLGNASAVRDKLLKNAILELAETRAIARALRFAGYGVEYTGAEEIPDGPVTVGQGEQSEYALSDDKVAAIFELAKNNGVSAAGIKKAITKQFNKTEVKQLTEAEYNKLHKNIEAMADK